VSSTRMRYWNGPTAPVAVSTTLADCAIVVVCPDDDSADMVATRPPSAVRHDGIAAACRDLRDIVKMFVVPATGAVFDKTHRNVSESKS
jgi:hypothetical protein